MEETPKCRWYEAAGNRNNYHVLKFDKKTAAFLDSTNIAFSPNTMCQNLTKTDITVITQLSADRLYLLEPMAQHWHGPVVFVFYVEKKQQCDRVVAFMRTSKTLHLRENILYFAAYRIDDEEHGLYPFNILRNIALHAARTEYVLHLDADFIPNSDAYSSLLKQIVQFKQEGRYGDRKVAFVIPAFESVTNDSVEVIQHLPQNKPSFVDLWLGQKQFRVFNGFWLPTEGSTNSKLWAVTSEPYVVQWHADYEPYILAKRCELPDFDERFVGRGFDKISHFYKLESELFQLVVLPNDFVIHIPHPRVSFVDFWNREFCVHKFQLKFLAELKFCDKDQKFCWF